MKGLGFIGKSKPYRRGAPKGKVTGRTNYSGKASEHQSGSRSANELLPPSASFVKLSDMSPKEWSAFLDKFQELLPGAFRTRKHTAGVGQRPAADRLTEEESSEMGRVRAVNTGQHGDLFCLYTHGQLGHFPCPTPHVRPPKRRKTSGEATEWLG